ncbi:MAG: alpha/beta hydrolase [Oscillospiraceae bacterium]|nr:alpha/beta hydrolase [Oscillospiraceae bacterium]
MLMLILLAAVLAAFLYALHFGYKLAFQYEDPLASPYNYPDTDQTRKVKPVLDPAIAAFLEAPYEDVSITSHDGLKLTGRYYHVSDGAPLEIQCHGYKGNPFVDFAGAWSIAKAAGRNVLLINQRCHGGSDGHTITFGILEKQDVMAWITYANNRFGQVPMLLNGVSMGAATVLMVSGMELPDNVKGIIADCPYDAPANIIKKVLAQDMGMPVKLVYPLIHGDDDRFVPHPMSCNIAAAAPETIAFYTISGAAHAMNYVTDPESYTAIVTAFTERCL